MPLYKEEFKTARLLPATFTFLLSFLNSSFPSSILLNPLIP